MYNTHSTLSAGKQIRLKTVADVTNGLQGRSAFVLSTAETYDAKVCSEGQEIGRELKNGNETEKKKKKKNTKSKAFRGWHTVQGKGITGLD